MATYTPKRLSDMELAEIASVNARENAMIAEWAPFAIDARRAHEQREKLLSHIASLTTPPSQGKVERARHETRAGEILKEKAEAYLITGLFVSNPILSVAMNAAITQALTESSGQGTDGAEAMWEKAEPQIRYCRCYRKYLAGCECFTPVSADGSAK